MMVLPRKVGESVILGDDIVITVIEIRGDRVRLGIEYPQGATVHRSEVYAMIQGLQDGSISATR